MPYMSQGGGQLNVGPMAGPGGGQPWSPGGGPGGGAPGGGGDMQQAFMEMLAQSRARKDREREEEMAFRQERFQAQQAAQERGFGMQEREQAQLMDLRGREGSTRGAMQKEQLAEMQAQRRAMDSFVPQSVIASRPGVTGGIVRDPTKGTVRGQQIYGQQGASFQAPSDSSVGDPGGSAWKADQKRRAWRNALAEKYGVHTDTMIAEGKFGDPGGPGAATKKEEG